jgi:hypothetical protein
MTIRRLMVAVGASALVLTVGRWIYGLDWMIPNKFLNGLINLVIPVSFIVWRACGRRWSP